MAKPTTVYECQACGYSSAKWLGRCPDCGSWNSFLEEKRTKAAAAAVAAAGAAAQAVRLAEVSSDEAPRRSTSDQEFDRVLGGGIVPGSLVLLGGEPGIGKSTLLLQIARNLQASGCVVLYVSGEESARQIKMRAERLGPGSEEIFILTEPNLERILSAVEDLRPTALVIDSIQTTCSDELETAPGSVSQVRYAAHRLLETAKTGNMPVFLIGHVTKDGSIAGPKALEHIVDTVLYFEGERHHNHRIVRAVKNRFGPANEIGIFEMTSRGLIPVNNPSRLFLSGGEPGSPGSVAACILEGTRPMLVEIQALVVATQFGTGRRMATGLDYNRIVLLAAMMEKKLEVPLTGCDIYVNVAGGLELREPAADLAVVAAIMSSFRNRAVAGKTVLLGEMGLSGEVRPVSQVHPRIREAGAMGFRRCILPGGNLPLVDTAEDVEVVPVKSVGELGDVIF